MAKTKTKKELEDFDEVYLWAKLHIEASKKIIHLHPVFKNMDLSKINSKTNGST